MSKKSTPSTRLLLLAATLIAGPLVLVYHDLPRSRVTKFAESLEESLAKVEEVL